MTQFIKIGEKVNEWGLVIPIYEVKDFPKKDISEPVQMELFEPTENHKK